MLYINQRRYPNIPYPTDMDTEGSPMQKKSVKEAGCGLCSLCMVVDHLTTKKLGLVECRDLAIALGANRKPGTDMKIIGPVVAERFGLSYAETSDIKKVNKTLHEGGEVIINAGGDHDGYSGIFTHGGHFMVIISEKGGKYCVLDPSQHKAKFKQALLEKKLSIDGYFIYTDAALLLKESENRSPAFYLFARK